jgi:hypothetical protein
MTPIADAAAQKGLHIFDNRRWLSTAVDMTRAVGIFFICRQAIRVANERLFAGRVQMGVYLGFCMPPMCPQLWYVHTYD